MDRRILLLLLVGLVGLTFAVYYRALGCDFINTDDPAYVTRNAHVRNGLTLRSVKWAFTTTSNANWHPLTWISHQIDSSIFGLKPWGHHLTAVVIHAANVALLLLALLALKPPSLSKPSEIQTTGWIWRCAFVAALFATHPLHAESVAWVAERKNVLSTLFWLFTMLAYARYVKRPSVGRYALVALSLALGLMAKPMLVSLPIILLILDYWPLGRMTLTTASHELKSSRKRPVQASLQKPFRVLLIEKTPLFALAAASCVVTFVVQRSGGAMTLSEQYSLGIRAANAIVSYLTYISKTLLPTKLSIFYPHPGNTLPTSAVTICGILLVAIICSAILCAKKHPYVTVGWLWYLVTLIPVIGLVQVGRQAMADRYAYIPVIGLFIIAAWSIPDLLALAIKPARLRTAAILVGASAAILANAMITWSNLTYWRNGVEVYKHALRSTNGHYGVYYLLADAFFETGKKTEAVQQLNQAIKANPRFAEAYVSLGTIAASEGKLDRAASFYRKALHMNPNLVSARTNLGLMLLQQHRIHEAIELLREAVRVDRHPAQPHYVMGAAYDKLGDIEKALKHYKTAVRIDPDLPDARVALATALIRQGELDAAQNHLQEAVWLKPDMPEAHFYLGYTFRASNEPLLAIPHYRAAIRLKPSWPLPYFWLAEALYRTGNYTAAWRELNRSIKLGYKPDPEFVQALSQKMSDPGTH
ncbi:MAG: tetratricopeptide repeat protein [Armatimonadetes bacterium]|nr:tetratricopeptide repeat protein [Armatimonadota bacterium]